MGRCYYYGNESAELKAVEKKEKTPVEKESDNVIKRIIIDDDTELVIEKDTVYEIDRKCVECKKNKEFVIKTAYEL